MFADAIVDGRKTIDIRRQRPNVKPGTLGLIYSSSPMQAILGSFRVDEIHTGTPEDLWLMTEGGAYISKEKFDKYFTDAVVGHALKVSRAQRLRNPIKLSDLRIVWPGRNPPRSFGYLVGADGHSRRIMTNFRARSFNDGSSSEECKFHHIDRTRLKDRKGSFLLSWGEVRALSSLFRAGGE